MDLREAVAKYEVNRLKTTENQYVWLLLHQSETKRQALNRLRASLVADPENDPPELTALIREAIRDLTPAPQEPVETVPMQDLPRLRREIQENLESAQRNLEGR